MSILSQGFVPTTTSDGAPLSAHQQAFARVLLGTAVVAGLTHLSFLLMMLWAGVMGLALANLSLIHI